MPQLSKSPGATNYQQKSFVFDGDSIRLPELPTARKEVAATTNAPLASTATCEEADEPQASVAAGEEAIHSFVRPDRQVMLDGPASSWPPLRDADCIAVDRNHADIDGPPHRFFIRRGDVVELFLSPEDSRFAEVLEINHARSAARVALYAGDAGVWFDVSRIFPAPIDSELEPSPPVAPSSIIDEVVPPPAASEFAEAVAVPAPEPCPPSYEPYSLEAFRQYRKRYEAGPVTLAEHQAEFSRLRETHGEFVVGLKQSYDATRLKSLAARFGCWDAKRNTKTENAEHVYRAILRSFSIEDGLRYNPMQETLEDALLRTVSAITPEKWEEHLACREEERETERKSHENPETLPEFRMFVRDLGVERLSDEQRVRFDELLLYPKW